MIDNFKLRFDATNQEGSNRKPKKQVAFHDQSNQ